MKEPSRFKAPFRGKKHIFTWKRRKSTPTKFRFFMQLPAEIRLQIWGYHEPRIVELVAEGAGHWQSFISPPAILSVCHESRQEAQKYYQRLRLADSNNCSCREKFVYFNFDCDTLYIGNGFFEIDRVAALLRSQEQLQKSLVNLALQHRIWSGLMAYDWIEMMKKLEAAKGLVVLHEAIGKPRKNSCRIEYQAPPKCASCVFLDIEERIRNEDTLRFPTVKSYGILRR